MTHRACAMAAVALLALACARGSLQYVGDISPPSDGTPVVFAPGVVSTGDVFASTFTPNGRTVVFTKVAGGRPLTLMTSHLRDGRWSSPETLPFSGVYRDLDPAFTPDGRRLYFSSRRPNGPSPADTTSLDDTRYADRDGNRWGVPVRISGAVNSDAMDMYPMSGTSSSRRSAPAEEARPISISAGARPQAGAPRRTLPARSTPRQPSSVRSCHTMGSISSSRARHRATAGRSSAISTSRDSTSFSLA